MKGKQNRLKAIVEHDRLAAAWKEVDEYLEAHAGTAEGYSAWANNCSGRNYHMLALLKTLRPSRWEIQFHVKGAERDLARARELVEQLKRERKEPCGRDSQ